MRWPPLVLASFLAFSMALCQSTPVRNKFTGPVEIDTNADGTLDVSAVSAGKWRLYEPIASGTNYSEFVCQSQAGNLTYTLPSAYPAVSGYALISTTAGAMSWSAVGSVTGSGTTNALPKWTSSTALGDSSLTQNASDGRLTQTISLTANAASTYTGFTQSYNFGTTSNGPTVQLFRFAPSGTGAGTAALEGFNFDFSGVSGTFNGGFTSLTLTTPSNISTSGNLSAASINLAVGGGGTVTNSYGVRVVASDDSASGFTGTEQAVFDVADGGWFSGLVTLTDWYGLRVAPVDFSAAGTVSNTHGWAVGFDSNITNSKWIYWGASVSTALASRSVGLKGDSDGTSNTLTTDGAAILDTCSNTTAAATITVNSCNVVTVTGAAATINTLNTCDGANNGRVLYILCDDSAATVFGDNTGNMRLSGTFTCDGSTGEADTLTLLCNGSAGPGYNWYELGRSVN